MYISKLNYQHMLTRARLSNKLTFFNHVFVNTMLGKYAEESKKHQATHTETSMLIKDKDYQKLMVLASY